MITPTCFFFSFPLPRPPQPFPRPPRPPRTRSGSHTLKNKQNKTKQNKTKKLTNGARRRQNRENLQEEGPQGRRRRARRVRVGQVNAQVRMREVGKEGVRGGAAGRPAARTQRAASAWSEGPACPPRGRLPASPCPTTPRNAHTRPKDLLRGEESDAATPGRLRGGA